MNEAPKSPLDDCSMSRAEIARRLGVDRSAITRWAQRTIPAERVLEVERLTGIPRSALRPDLYPVEPSEAAE